MAALLDLLLVVWQRSTERLFVETVLENILSALSNEAPQPVPFDWKRPDYGAVIRSRIAYLARIRANPQMLPALHSYYRLHPERFISDFGCTSDPRNVERGVPTTIPFLLFKRQEQWVQWLLERWHAGEPGITEKSREMGMSWLSVALACTLCLFNKGMVVGFGSRKEEYVDKRGAPKALFEKARFFLSHLPAEFLGGWDRDRHAPHMRILFPGTGSAITGESGDGIGRGDRCGIYFVDEAAFLEHPELADASLSQTTNCRQDISTPNGLNNSFAIRRHSGKIPVFTFNWRDDPRKSLQWYRRQSEILDPVTLAGEVDIDYRGSVEGQLIPASWINSAIGARQKLGIEPSGTRLGALDVADAGRDANCFAGRYGIELEHLHSWSGRDSDIYKTVVRAFFLCDSYDYPMFYYDGDGLGAGVRGDANKINEERKSAGRPYIQDKPFRGSGAVHDPEGEMIPKRKNKDFFANLKAMSWWSLRQRFQATHRAIAEGQAYMADELISINPKLEELQPLIMELGQPTYSLNSVGKVVIDKQPDNSLSPNRADSVMIAFAPSTRWMELWAKLAM
jgi:phage terminase large subunit